MQIHEGKAMMPSDLHRQAGRSDTRGSIRSTISMSELSRADSKVEPRLAPMGTRIMKSLELSLLITTDLSALLYRMDPIHH
eukprot:jgi/Botrbrau1/21972/Bobra.0249s0094.1